MRACVRRSMSVCVDAFSRRVPYTAGVCVCVCVDAFNRRIPYTSGVSVDAYVCVRVRVCTKQQNLYIFIIAQIWLPVGGHDDCRGGQPEGYLPQFPDLAHGRPRPCPEHIKSNISQ